MHDLFSHLLNYLILLPTLTAIVLILFPKEKIKLIRIIAEFIFTVILSASIILFISYDSNLSGYQYLFQVTWIAAWGAFWSIGVDGIALTLILLTAFLFPISLRLAAWQQKPMSKGFILALLFLQSALFGVFCARDMLLFYVFWEAMLIPLYFLIGIWGGEQRVQAAVRFFLYTLAGSLLMLAAILYMYLRTSPIMDGDTLIAAHSFLMDAFQDLEFSSIEQKWLFVAFAAAFLIKAPIFPFHGWQPLTYAQSPFPVAVILAGVLGKTAIYGLMRIAVPFFTDVVIQWSPYLLGLSAFTILFGALVAWIQKEIRYWIAYASLSHMGMMTLGVFSLSSVAWTGVILLMFSHGIILAGIFIIVAFLQERIPRDDLAFFGGLWKPMPVFGALLLIFLLAMVGLPGTNGFIGEFMIFAGTFNSELSFSTVMAIIAISGVIFSAMYVFRFYQQLMTGPVKNIEPPPTDLKNNEIGLLIPLVILIFLIGFYPAIIYRQTENDVNQIIGHTSKKSEILIRSCKKIPISPF